MVLGRFTLVCLFCGVYSAFVSGQSISVVNTSAAPSPSDGHINVFLKVEPVEKNAKLPDLVVQDVTGPDKSAFQQIGTPTFLGRSDTKAYWRTSWLPDGQPANSAPLRVLHVKFGDASDLISVTLQKPETPQVTLTGPGFPLKLSDSHVIAFQIVSSGRLTNVAPAFSTLVEEKTGQVVSVDKLSLDSSAQPTDAKTSGITVEPSSHVVYLRVAPGFDKPGKFSGNVSISSREKADLGSFPVTIYSTSGWRKVVGGICLALGVFIYFAVAIWVKGKNKELLATLPATRLKEEAQSLRKIVRDAKRDTGASFGELLDPRTPPTNQNSLDFMIEELSVKKLKLGGYLPQDFFSAFSGDDPSAKYQTFLAEKGNRLAALEIIIRSGIATILDKWKVLVDDQKTDAGVAALNDLDSLASAMSPSDQLKKDVQKAIQLVDSAITGGMVGGGAALWRPVADMGSREITVHLQQLSKLVWLLWGVGTVFVGLLALVLFNDSFGRGQDWIQCVLWGIGMPATAQGFGGLSASSVTSALSLPIPR